MLVIMLAFCSLYGSSSHKLWHFVSLSCSTMSERAAKLQKLNDFRRRLPHCSASALGAILAEVRKHGLPEGGTGRNNMREARDLENLQATPHGPILQTLTVIDKEDQPKQLTIANTFAMLWKAASAGQVSTFLQRKLAEVPPSPDQPWNLVVYTDEVTPGDPLATLNKRKFHAMYWSFMELGLAALSREEAWFTITCEYSVLVNQLHSGLSQVVAACLKVFFGWNKFRFDWNAASFQSEAVC